MLFPGCCRPAAGSASLSSWLPSQMRPALTLLLCITPGAFHTAKLALRTSAATRPATPVIQAPTRAVRHAAPSAPTTKTAAAPMLVWAAPAPRECSLQVQAGVWAPSLGLAWPPAWAGCCRPCSEGAANRGPCVHLCVQVHSTRGGVHARIGVLRRGRGYLRCGQQHMLPCTWHRVRC